MRDFAKSLVSFSWALSFFGIEQIRAALLPRPDGRSGADALDSVTRAAENELGPDLRSLYEGIERWQHGVLDMCLAQDSPDHAAVSRAPARAPLPPSVRPSPVTSAPEMSRSPAAAPAHQPMSGVPSAAAAGVTRPSRSTISPSAGRLGDINFVVMGDALPAGMGDFAVFDDWQQASFVSCVARQFGVDLPLPLIQAPGIGVPPGTPAYGVRVPAAMQTTVRGDFPSRAIRNLSVPGFRLVDLLTWRPEGPVVSRTDARRTAGNLMLGLPDLAAPDCGELPTPVQRALATSASLALVSIGYEQALEAALSRNDAPLPARATWRGHWQQLLSALAGRMRVIVTTIPDPLDTPACSSLESAARVLKIAPAILREHYSLQPDDRLTVGGLWQIAYDLLDGARSVLGSDASVPGAIARQVSDDVAQLNDELRATAKTYKAHVFDLGAVFRRFREGVAVRDARLSNDFLGGLFTLNGAFPGRTAHACIANALLTELNGAFDANFPLLDLEAIAREDPVAAQQLPVGPERTELPFAVRAKRPVPARVTAEASANGGDPLAERAATLPMRLPPDLQQVLPLSARASYHGDAIRIVHCTNDRDRQFGSCGDLYFGGLVMFDSHLSGDLRITFTPPVEQITRFEIRHDDLAGEEADLAAPAFFKWPVRGCRVRPAAGAISSGTLNLATGEVTDLQVYVHYENSALAALAAANPTFPRQPIAFPGQYGSAWARFDQRADGTLDFTFYGSTFIPLEAVLGGPPARWALPFSSSAGFASIPASGMALHPHLHLTTREPEPGCAGAVPTLPSNTVQELTLLARNSSFGDKFTLNTPDLGGEATGRSHLMGRLQVQFGPRFGDAVSIATTGLTPGALLAAPPDSPIAAAFPGRLSPGPLGHDEHLRFPLRNYYLDGVALLDDPFDLAVGAVDLLTGRLLNDFLRRGFIAQDLFYALIRVEPRTPQSSFSFRGPALFEAAGDGALRFRFKGAVGLAYPEGFRFPGPDLTSGFAIGANSRLDPFVWLQAVGDARPPRGGRRGGARQVRASNGEEFSYRYRLPADPAREHAFFEYENHSQNGVFRMHRLAWYGFARSRAVPLGGEPDVSTFSGYGWWSKDGGQQPHIATVQISDGELDYVSVQIDGGLVSNVNTRPGTLADAQP